MTNALISGETSLKLTCHHINRRHICFGDSSRAPGLTSGFQGVRECPPWCSIVGDTVTVHHFFCILNLSLSTYYSG